MQLRILRILPFNYFSYSVSDWKSTWPFLYHRKCSSPRIERNTTTLLSALSVDGPTKVINDRSRHSWTKLLRQRSHLIMTDCLNSIMTLIILLSNGPIKKNRNTNSYFLITLFWVFQKGTIKCSHFKTLTRNYNLKLLFFFWMQHWHNWIRPFEPFQGIQGVPLLVS